jgi:hypothetical protein
MPKYCLQSSLDSFLLKFVQVFQRPWRRHVHYLQETARIKAKPKPRREFCCESEPCSAAENQAFSHTSYYLHRLDKRGSFFAFNVGVKKYKEPGLRASSGQARRLLTLTILHHVHVPVHVYSVVKIAWPLWLENVKRHRRTKCPRANTNNTVTLTPPSSILHSFISSERPATLQCTILNDQYCLS